MRILFSGTPAFGHLLPMLPLAKAANRAGHETALLTHASMADAVLPLRVLPAGPTVEEVLAEVTRRTGADASADMSPVPAAEFFGGARVDLGAEEALAAARTFAPDLVIADEVDYLGRLAAASLGVPWASHGMGVALDDELEKALDTAAGGRFAERGLSLVPRIASISPWPDRLQREGWAPSADRIAVRPEPHSQDDEEWSAPGFPGREDRPRVLVTLGTFVDDSETLGVIVKSLATQNVNVVIAVNPRANVDDLEVDRSWVHPVGFVPMQSLLEGVSVVVSAAGAGTVLAAMSSAVPMVLIPMGLDKPLNAERAAALGAAAVVHSAEKIGDAVSRVLADPSYAQAAAKAALDIAQMHSPDDVLHLLLERYTSAQVPQRP
ncbi:glycosyltransferase [Streptomyces sp. NPDC001177]